MNVDRLSTSWMKQMDESPSDLMAAHRTSCFWPHQLSRGLRSIVLGQHGALTSEINELVLELPRYYGTLPFNPLLL